MQSFFDVSMPHSLNILVLIFAGELIFCQLAFSALFHHWSRGYIGTQYFSSAFPNSPYIVYFGTFFSSFLTFSFVLLFCIIFIKYDGLLLINSWHLYQVREKTQVKV